MTDRVSPRLARGMRDLLPDQMLARQWMTDTIRGVYELYGFVPLSTPAIEHLDVLTGSAGTEAQASIFHVKGPDDDALALRFDLTVPLARVISQYPDLPRPFRRYQVAPVWRADKPGPGRFREFTQFDLDSVGVVSEIADTEIIAGMCDTLSALKVDNYSVRFSSRALLNLLLDYAGIPRDAAHDVFRVLDKLEKIGAAKVRLELTTGYKDESGDVIEGLGLAGNQVDRIEAFLAIQAADRREVIGRVRELFKNVPDSDAEIRTIQVISDHLYALGYGDNHVTLDLSIARGLAYYTGTVFEAVLTDAPHFGSVFGGGRYDGLVTRFLGEAVPAVGASIGVDRLLAALEHLGKLKVSSATSKVLVTRLDPDLTADYVEITWELRRAGIPAEIYLGTQKRVPKQLRYADECGIPICLLYGSNEKAQGEVTLKDMEMGRKKSQALADRQEWLEERPGQQTVPRAELVARVRAMLASIEAPGA